MDQGRLAVDREMAPLQPRRENARKARRAPIRIAWAPKDMAAPRQIRWIRLRQQTHERVVALRIDDLHHGRYRPLLEAVA
jgi:hypothetical protein